MWHRGGQQCHQGRKGENGDGNRDAGENRGEDECGNKQEGRDGGENGSGNGNGNRRENGGENRDGGRGEREPGNLRSSNRGGSQDARTPTSNQQPQPQDPTPQRDRRIMLKNRAQGREARYRIGEGGGEAKKRKKLRGVVDAMWETGKTWAEREKNVDKKGLVL